ncbi:MAG: hypothetical protein RL669_1872 [Pseudomonadota bacterium]|jgi:hypothetical protein
MERRAIANRWVSEVWTPVAVIEQEGDEGGAPVLVERDEARERWLHPGFSVGLFRDEAEGYYLNLTTDTPFAFVEWEAREDGAVPLWVTLSYNEAARRMDGGALVEGVPMPPDWLPWVAEFTETHFKPPKKKERIRPPSFKGARRDES